jgi:hypothetical protein
MSLDAVGMSNAADAGFTQSLSGGHRPGAPVRGVTCFFLNRLLHHLQDAQVVNRARPPGRGASFCKATKPPSRKRLRHRAAFAGVIPSSAAIY